MTSLMQKKGLRRLRRRTNRERQKTSLPEGGSGDEDQNNLDKDKTPVVYDSKNHPASKKTCPVDSCTKQFASSKHLAKHMKRHPTPVICRNCKKAFLKFSDLRRHFNGVHEKEKPFTCPTCQQRFSCVASLKRHQYNCDICGVAFDKHRVRQASTTLDKHRRRHTGVKPYECDTCEKKFLDSSSLKRHSRTHTGHRPYACAICTHRCSTSSNLKLHMAAVHAGEKRWSCDECEFRTARKAGLRNHKQRIHGNEQPPSSPLGPSIPRFLSL